MTLPTIHLNGTSAKSLYKMNEDAMNAIWKAIQALEQAAPNARDYYPQGNAAFAVAATEHNKRIARLQDVRAELNAILEHVLDNEAAQ